VAVLLGVMVAACFGSGDFLGGRASQHAPTIGVLLVAQCSALIGAALAAVLIGADVDSADLVFGAVAGALNAAALGFLYRGLATGRMGVVAPVTAVVASVVPISWGLASGERPSTAVFVGVVVAVTAGALIAREPDGHDTSGSSGAVGIAVTAGGLFGVSFVCFAETGDDSGYWPVLTARVAAVVGVAVVAWAVAALGLPARLPAGHARRLAVAAGSLDVVATVLLLTAVREGLMVVVAPIAALAPAFTVVWAWAVLRERVTRHQVVGLALALVGLVLIAAG
jgi:uncharacterized membrane protein